jgi:uncharacterized protein YjiS (DUF1127 family)
MSNLTVPTFRPRVVRQDLPSWRKVSFAAMAGISATVRTWIARRRGRLELQELAEYGEDHLLDDIGVTRKAALRAAEKWFWQR